VCCRPALCCRLTLLRHRPQFCLGAWTLAPCWPSCGCRSTSTPMVGRPLLLRPWRRWRLPYMNATSCWSTRRGRRGAGERAGWLQGHWHQAKVGGRPWGKQFWGGGWPAAGEPSKVGGRTEHLLAGMGGMLQARRPRTCSCCSIAGEGCTRNSCVGTAVRWWLGATGNERRVLCPAYLQPQLYGHLARWEERLCILKWGEDHPGCGTQQDGRDA